MISRWLDRVAIRTACRSVAPSRVIAGKAHVGEHLDYFAPLPAKVELAFENDNAFRFASPFPSKWKENNTVAGRLYRAGGARRRPGPAVLLLHGWNGEQGYRYLFPLLAWRFRQLGLTVAMIELPYHGTRKPRSGNLRNFLSGDIEHMMEATRQAIGDIRGMLKWLAAEGYDSVGLWGVSLGAWLGGLVACVEEDLQAAVLLTPVPRLDEAIAQLPFCRHIRASVEGSPVSVADLNLMAHEPKLGPENILIVESTYDLFASPESVEELWQSWGQPEIWRVAHGHISVLLSPMIMNRTGRWLSRHLRNTALA